MRHRKIGRKLGRNSTHRKAMFANMLASLIEHGRIETTEAKAKELRRIAERTITWATSLGDLLTADRDKLSKEERAKIVHHIRMAGRKLKNREMLLKLFNEVGPRFVGRPGGYTRVIRHYKTRHGDGARLAFIELLPEEETESASAGGEETAEQSK